MTLDDVFGPGLPGDTAEVRAAKSPRVFVRSQVQLALDSPKAKGRRISAFEALSAFGLPFLEKVVTDGGAGLVTDGAEPARTLAARRKFLRLSKTALAQAAGVTHQEVNSAEMPGNVSSIRTLERIAQALALDERQLGARPTARGDLALGTRLRELNSAESRDDAFISVLTDAAWVISRQTELSRLLNASHQRLANFTETSSDYGFPAYERGYLLAERTRSILGIEKGEPIRSAYDLAQDVLGVAVVDTNLGLNILGATIINGGSRGIALSDDGPNRSILVRRMTLAHELGHLLWDSDAQLGKVRIDHVGEPDKDPVEIRANAFAVAFLAPPESVRQIHKQTGEPRTTVLQIVDTFGISPVAAAHHLVNVCKMKLSDLSYNRTAAIASYKKWSDNEARPSLVTGHVPPSRAGRFSQLAIQAARRGLITLDTLTTWLKIDGRVLRDFF